MEDDVTLQFNNFNNYNVQNIQKLLQGTPHAYKVTNVRVLS